MAEEKTRGRILLVEDDKFLSTALADKLAREGFAVIKASNGEEALAKVRLARPDLVLLDLIMPQKTGFEVLADLKLEPSTKNIPVIVLSNLGQEADIKKAKELGARDYLVKSDVEMKTVVEKIKAELAKTVQP
ncbi:MAG: response regulator [Candidatus Vogelbacteria bacterium]|nr:response regulator [Candidatus Vogelbacteria bacterium]